MELAPAPLNLHYAVPNIRPSSIAFRTFSPSLPIFRATIPGISSPRLASKSTGVVLACRKVSFRSSCVAANVGDATAEMTESDKTHTPLSTKADLEAKDEACKEGDEGSDSEQSDDYKMVRVSDKLIDIFMVDKPTPNDWRKLLTFSKQWDNIRPHFYQRCQDRAESETNPGMKLAIFRLARKLKEVDQDIQRHNELLNVVKKSPSDVGEVVARRRKDFTKEFFVHVHTVAESYPDDLTERDAVMKLRDTCIAAVQAYDGAAQTIEALNAAELKALDIVNSPSAEAACRKIDNLAEKNQLDSATVQMVTKAWSGTKETDMVKDEATDVLFHLYKTAVASLQRDTPKEARILKYLLTIEDPEELMSTLKDAFTPGEQIEGEDIDYLYTTPHELHTLISNLLDAYQSNRQLGVMTEAKDLMNPKVMLKLEELIKIVQDKFM